MMLKNYFFMAVSVLMVSAGMLFMLLVWSMEEVSGVVIIDVSSLLYSLFPLLHAKNNDTAATIKRLPDFFIMVKNFVFESG